MERGFRFGFVLAMVTVGAACADDPYVKLKGCTSGWTVMDGEAPTASAIAWADGVLYAASYVGIYAMPTGGGTGKWLMEDWSAFAVEATDIWVEGDSVLYAVEDRLMRIPRTGGTPTTLVDGGHAAMEIAPSHLYDGTYFIWANAQDWSVTDVWQSPVSGGATERYGRLPTQPIRLMMAPVADGILGGHSGRGGGAAVAPKGQTTWRYLKEDPTMDTLLAMDSGGALWTAYNQAVVGLAPADGSPWRVLSTKLPPAHWATSDGKGGYFIASVEKFDDEREHDSMWHLAPDGSADRIACNPQGTSEYDKAVVTPDALYVITITDPWHPSGRIAKITRPNP